MNDGNTTTTSHFILGESINFELNVNLASEFSLVHSVSKLVEGILKSTLSDESLIFNLNLSLVEALNNCVIHAYKKQNNRVIRLKCLLSKEKIEYYIFDEIKLSSRINSALENSKNAVFDEANILKESGRGLFLIQSLMDEVKWIELENGKQFYMRKQLEPDQQIKN